MIIVGELINASRKAITEAIKNRDVEAVQAVARQEHEAGAIINPLDKRMMANIIVAEALAGRDSYCMKAFRAKQFEL